MPIIGSIEKQIAATILNAFLPLAVTVPFSEPWLEILPMDNSIKDTLMPSCFAEFWVDMDKAAGKTHIIYASRLRIR